MSDLDARLAEALRPDAPPVRDPIFRVEVLTRLERARFKRRAAFTVALAAVAAVLAALSAPAIDAWVSADLQRVWIAGPGLAAALFVLSGLFAPRSGIRTVMRTFGRWMYL
jgi:hypothetical protein